MNPVVAQLLWAGVFALATFVAGGGTTYLRTHDPVDSAVVGAVAAATAVLGPAVRDRVVAMVREARPDPGKG